MYHAPHMPYKTSPSSFLHRNNHICPPVGASVSAGSLTIVFELAPLLPEDSSLSASIFSIGGVAQSPLLIQPVFEIFIKEKFVQNIIKKIFNIF